MHIVQLCKYESFSLSNYTKLYNYAQITWYTYIYSLLSKIGDDGDSEADDGEYGPNVGHPSEGIPSWRRGWEIRADVLNRRDKRRDMTNKLNA